MFNDFTGAIIGTQNMVDGSVVDLLMFDSIVLTV